MNSLRSLKAGAQITANDDIQPIQMIGGLRNLRESHNSSSERELLDPLTIRRPSRRSQALHDQAPQRPFGRTDHPFAEKLFLQKSFGRASLALVIPRQEDKMARNTGKGHRQGPINEREQYQTDDGMWVKVDNNGNVIGVKQGEPFKGVRKK